jgi:NAD(P)-dependent dehydrogenase (short-subunit alcohol dehydrogenase family)
MLFLNAAICETEHKLTDDNLEIMFQVNYLSQFYLARLLTPTLMSTSNSRLVIISCEAHRY